MLAPPMGFGNDKAGYNMNAPRLEKASLLRHEIIFL